MLIIVDPETILKEEYGKTPCIRYMTVGDCAFGMKCRFSHYTPPMIWELQRLGNHSTGRFIISLSRREHVNLQRITFLFAAAVKNFKSSINQPKDGWPNPEDIIKEYFENVTDSSGTEDNYSWNMPSRLVNYSFLPPSLQLATSESITNCSFNKWGWVLPTLKIKR